MEEEDAVRILPEEEFFEFKCKWHCILCGRHFFDEKAWENHYDTPANFGGCHRPTGNSKLLVGVAEDGVCGMWSWFSWRPGWEHTPRRDVRVYWSERVG